MNALVSMTPPIRRLARLSSAMALSMIALPISISPGCAVDSSAPQAGVEAAVQVEPLLRGFPANAPELNAIGAIYVEVEPGPPARLAFICTGTLITRSRGGRSRVADGAFRCGPAEAGASLVDVERNRERGRGKRRPSILRSSRPRPRSTSTSVSVRFWVT